MPARHSSGQACICPPPRRDCVVDVSRLTENLFREEAGKLVSVLTGIFGIERLQLAEDVVQEALVRAFQTWPYYGAPKNPAAWLTQTAKNIALDVIRREKRFREKQPEIELAMDRWSAGSPDEETPAFDEEIQDDRLRLMFACCHPSLPIEAQTALALRTLCGLSAREIAKAFLASDAAIEKRLTRARQKIRDEHIPFEIPAGSEMTARLDGVLRTLYLLFNEGYKASSGDRLVRADLCHEAIRLAGLLAAHPAGNQPRTHALLSLMLLNAARLPGRIDSDGNILRLAEQDRFTWDGAMIARGIRHLGLAADGDSISEYHLQAAIAMCHCGTGVTNWPDVLSLYDHWQRINDSPLIALNRAVALANVEGPAAGLAAIEAIPNRDQLSTYYLFHAVLGDFEARQEHFGNAAAHFRRAIQLAEQKSEREFLARRLAECESRS
ncbi:MAG: RNA polymerase sigma factor [Chthoniobacterales bacterium]